MEIGTGCYKIRRVQHTEKIKIDAELLAENKQIERTFTKILKILKGMDYRIEEDENYTYIYYNTHKQLLNKKFNVPTDKIINNFEQFLQKEYNLTLNDVITTDISGEWQIKQKRTFFKKFIPFLQEVPKIIVFHDTLRDYKGKFQSEYTTWRRLRGV